jgi:hypothetical protein
MQHSGWLLDQGPLRNGPRLRKKMAENFCFGKKTFVFPEEQKKTTKYDLKTVLSVF